MGGGVNFAPQAPAYNPQGFNAQQYGVGAGAAAAAPQFNSAASQQQQQRTQAFQMPQPPTTFQYPLPNTQQQQQQAAAAAAMGDYQPTATPAAIAAANQGYNNMLMGLGQGLTNLGHNMAAGPPPAPVTGYAMPMGQAQQRQQAGVYRGATLRATYPGIGQVDLGVPKVGEGGASATIAPSAEEEATTGATTNTASQTTSALRCTHANPVL